MIKLLKKATRRVTEIPTLIERYKTDRALNSFSISSREDQETRTLVDACYDNPHYWFRYCLIRKSLGLKNSFETGLVSKIRTRYQRSTLKALGIKNIIDIDSSEFFQHVNMEEINTIFSSLRNAEDILTAKLPFQFSGKLVYDYILKKEKRAFVDLKSLKTKTHFIDICSKLYIYDYLVDQIKPNLVISSHAVGIYSTLVHIALSKGIKVVIPYGNAGVARFWQLNSTKDIFNFMDRPTHDDFINSSQRQLDNFYNIGETYLKSRLNGLTTNLGATYAFNNKDSEVSKEKLYQYFNTTPGKPIACIYASNWFDYPHTFGMSNFRDFYDWIKTTIDVIKDKTDTLWLIKPHPIEQLYGGQKLKDLIRDGDYDHIKFSDEEWNGHSLMKELDLIITFHGSIGIEASSLGKPVLVADIGWYHDCGFVRWPKSRNDYIASFNNNWWKEIDTKIISKKSIIFCGWYWGSPPWQGKFILEDDAKSWKLYPSIRQHLKHNTAIIEREVNIIYEWYNSNKPHYHTYKMKNHFND